ncbi:hypothetical protein CEXT_443711 [Caerostris extrusa]|uniref:Uncharacterized protein n=1 Tax=Caerostris extrusa TaxID=172846 RepID=A0AAV4WZH6_CAEEX|nr:hypothetical protein CEXT_443711 [Caerostris extrusa]
MLYIKSKSTPPLIKKKKKKVRKIYSLEETNLEQEFQATSISLEDGYSRCHWKIQSSRYEYIQTSLHTTPSHMHTGEQNKMPNLYFQAANKDTPDCTSWIITAYNALHKGRKRLSHQTLPPKQWHSHTETTRVLLGPSTSI